MTNLILGECIEEMAKLPAGSVDAVICDPPYSSGGIHATSRKPEPARKYGAAGTKLDRPSFGGDNRDQRSYLTWSWAWMEEALRVMKPGAPICVFSDWRQIPILTDSLQCAGFVWRGIAVWDKTNECRPVMGRFSHQCEFILWGSSGPMALEREIGKLPGCFTFPTRQSDKFHMTGKPTGLMREIVKIVTSDGVVLDPFMGSGTTGVAALLEGRRFVGIERDPGYFEIARKRIDAAAA